MEGLHVGIAGLRLQVRLRGLLELHISQGKHFLQVRAKLVRHRPVLAQVLVEGDADQELKELDKLHIIVLRCVDRLVDDGHLGQIEQLSDGSLRNETSDGLEDPLG